MSSGTIEAGISSSLFLRTLKGEKTERPPLWLMRQAGRYLPEYRAVRAKAGSFLDLCYNPDLATEVTLQPIRRFGFDAAILFSDILVIPHALGQNVTFAEGEGPRLPPLMISPALNELKSELDLDLLAPIFQTIRQLKSELPSHIPLIGFCGAPWTVASYMIAGKGTPDQAPIRLLAYREPVFLKALIDRLVDSSISYLCQQAAAGVDTIQIFESFAGALPPHLFGQWSLEPLRRIVAGVRALYPDIPVIIFARGAGAQTAQLADGFIQAVGLDWMSDPIAMDRLLPANVPVQGNLDPLALIAGGEALERRCTAIREAFATRPHIFNLGHGILPETPIAHVERLVELIQGGN
jgi:uroporphyrinogen decarboxylase